MASSAYYFSDEEAMMRLVVRDHSPSEDPSSDISVAYCQQGQAFCDKVVASDHTFSISPSGKYVTHMYEYSLPGSEVAGTTIMFDTEVTKGAVTETK